MTPPRNLHVTTQGMTQAEYLSGGVKRFAAPSSKASSEVSGTRETKRSDVKRVVLTLPWPPSVNEYWHHGRGNNTWLSPKAKEFRDAVFLATRHESTRFRQSRLAIFVEAFPPDRRKRDLSNLWKGLEDSLVNAGLLDDDEQFDDEQIVRRDVEKPGRVVVEIREIGK